MVPQGCVLSFQAEEVESMHGNYFSLGTLVQSNPTAFPPPPCFSACIPSVTLLSAFWFMQLLGQFQAPVGEQFATEGLFSGPQLKRFPGDGATEEDRKNVPHKTRGIPPCTAQDEAPCQGNPSSDKVNGHLLQQH